MARAKPTLMMCSPVPDILQATPVFPLDGCCAQQPAPNIAASPTRPEFLRRSPPLDTPAATLPQSSHATAPTVSFHPLLPVLLCSLGYHAFRVYHFQSTLLSKGARTTRDKHQWRDAPQSVGLARMTQDSLRQLDWIFDSWDCAAAAKLASAAIHDSSVALDRAIQGEVRASSSVYIFIVLQFDYRPFDDGQNVCAWY